MSRPNDTISNNHISFNKSNCNKIGFEWQEGNRCQDNKKQKMKMKEGRQVKDAKMFVVEKMEEKIVRGDRGMKEVKNQLGGRD